MADYPELEGFAYSFQRAELTCNGKIFTAISGVSFEQATEEGAVMGTKPWPLSRTEGAMQLGEGTITFSDERERIAFVDSLGDGYRQQLWELSWQLADENGGSQVKFACQGCRVLSVAVSHEQGADALGGEVQFSFLAHTINGKKPHI